MTKVRVRYAPIQLDTCILGMQEQHYLTTYLPATMTENLSFVSRYRPKTEHRRRREKSVGKLSMVRDGMG